MSLKGVLIRYLMKISDYSRQQITRLIAQYRKTGKLKRRQRTVAGHAGKYTLKDIRLLAAMDKRHNTPCGPAVKKLCERAFEVPVLTQFPTDGGFVTPQRVGNLRLAIIVFLQDVNLVSFLSGKLRVASVLLLLGGEISHDVTAACLLTKMQSCTYELNPSLILARAFITNPIH